METADKVKYTPGPWRVDAHYLQDIQTENGSLEIACVDSGVLIRGTKPSDGYERRANARLIAAAPELLEAVKAMQAACDEWAAEFTQHKRAMDWGVVNEAYLKASRSIAKAESR